MEAVETIEKDIFDLTSGLTKAASYMPCEYPEPKMLFREFVINFESLLKNKLIRFAIIGDQTGARKGKWTENLKPVLKDESFEQYHERLSGILNHGSSEKVRYQIAINELEALSTKFKDWLLRFYQPVLAKTGLPRGLTYTVTFVGDYKTTSFGIHFDDDHGFHVPVVGKKKMLHWDLKKYRLDEIYSSQVEESLATYAEPGNCMFWPPRYWHVGSSDGESLSVSIAPGTTLYNKKERIVIALRLFPAIIAKFLWFCLSRPGMKKKLYVALMLVWCRYCQKDLDQNGGFVRSDQTPRKSVKEILFEQSLGMGAMKVRKKGISPTYRGKYQLATTQQPLLHKSRKGNYLSLNGHVFKDGDSAMTLLERLRGGLTISCPEDDARIKKAFLWLFKIRAISVADIRE